VTYRYSAPAPHVGCFAAPSVSDDQRFGARIKAVLFKGRDHKPRAVSPAKYLTAALQPPNILRPFVNHSSASGPL
jgi:hypothetical protein